MPRATEQWEAPQRTLQPLGGRGIRRLLQASVIAAAGIMGTIQATAQETRNAINEHLKSIPADLPHLAAKEELLQEGAAHGLIVIRQIHWCNNMDQQLAEEVEQCQREVKAMLEVLLEKGLIDEVYAEGVMAAGEPAPNPAYCSHDSADRQGIEISSIAEWGAVDELSSEGKLIMKGGERTKEYDLSGVVINDPPSEKRDRALKEDREDALLGIIEEANDDKACTVYGADHRWENNVRDHPGKFSLVTITPNAVAAYDKRMLLGTPPPPPHPSDVSQPATPAFAPSDILPPPPGEY